MGLFRAVGVTLTSKKRLVITFLASIVVMLLAVFIPVITIPGNSIGTQLSLMMWDSAILIILISFLFGLSVGMHSYADELTKSNKNMVNSTSMGTLSVMASLFAGKLCPFCISAILSVVGLGGAAFSLLSYRNEILIASLFIMGFSIYFAAKRINEKCNQCERRFIKIERG